MNRIRKIKVRLESKFYVYSEDNIDGGVNEYREAHDDIQYLLSKLEIAENALYDVLTEYGHDHIEPSERLKEIEYIAQDALQQIRE